MEPELPLPVTEPWWQPCPELESFLNEDMKWGWGLLGSLVMLCWTVMPSWQETVLNTPLGACGVPVLAPLGWGDPTATSQQGWDSSDATQLTKSATRLPAWDLVAKEPSN